jgi:hypothetical protein
MARKENCLQFFGVVRCCTSLRTEVNCCGARGKEVLYCTSNSPGTFYGSACLKENHAKLSLCHRNWFGDSIRISASNRSRIQA